MPGDTLSEMTDSSEAPEPSGVLRNRNFLLLWLGSSVSVLGDQFFMIALPWLVLVITGDSAVALGTIMAVAGIPRAVFMLFGGAVADRFSPRIVIMFSSFFRMVLVGALSAIVLAGSPELWMIYVLVLCFGFADAFSFPAHSALLPRIVESGDLARANALMGGTMQIAGFAGPALAGLLIAFFGSTAVAGSEVADIRGIGMAFAVDAASFSVPILALGFVRLKMEGAASEARAHGIIASILEGIRYVWHHPVLRAFIFIIAAFNFLINGPIIIGIPVLVRTVFGEGSVAFGLIMSAGAGGALLGTAFAGILPRPRPERFGVTVLGLGTLAGGMIAVIAMAPTIEVAIGAMFVSSVFNGYTNIMFQTWFQQRTPGPVLGRVMSTVMLSSQGLAPISMALAGFLIAWDVRFVIAAAGILTGIIGASSLFLRTVRLMDVIAAEQEGQG